MLILLKGNIQWGIVNMEELEGTESNKCLFTRAAFKLKGEQWI